MCRPKKFAWSILSLCLLLCLCSHNEGLSPAEEDLLVETYVRLSLAAQEQAGDVEGLAAARQEIFRSLGTDAEEFRHLTQRVENTPERWTVIWERITERLEELQQKATESSNPRPSSGRSPGK